MSAPKEGFAYLTFILDACSQKVVGWSMATHLQPEEATFRFRNPSPAEFEEVRLGEQGGA